MKGITIVTNEDHINANDDRAFNMGAVISDDVVLNIGNKFAYTLDSVNQITISDGDGVLQGLHFRIPEGSVQSIAIENGTTGRNRIDTIVVRYKKDQVTSLESVSLVLIKGTAVAGTPSAPATLEWTSSLTESQINSNIISGSLRNGDLVADMPLYNITLSGLSVESVTALFGIYDAASAAAAVKKDGLARYTQQIIPTQHIKMDGQTLASELIRYVRSGNVVTAFFELNFSTDMTTSSSAMNMHLYTAANTAAVVPQGFRPVHSVMLSVPHVSAGKMADSHTRYNIPKNAAITIQTNAMAMFERRGAVSWVTDDDWPE